MPENDWVPPNPATAGPPEAIAAGDTPASPPEAIAAGGAPPAGEAKTVATGDTPAREADTPAGEAVDCWSIRMSP